jgi:hypothetical protein
MTLDAVWAMEAPSLHNQGQLQWGMGESLCFARAGPFLPNKLIEADR